MTKPCPLCLASEKRESKLYSVIFSSQILDRESVKIGTLLFSLFRTLNKRTFSTRPIVPGLSRGTQKLCAKVKKSEAEIDARKKMHPTLTCKNGSGLNHNVDFPITDRVPPPGQTGFPPGPLHWGSGGWVGGGGVKGG